MKQRSRDYSVAQFAWRFTASPSLFYRVSIICAESARTTFFKIEGHPWGQVAGSGKTKLRQ